MANVLGSTMGSQLSLFNKKTRYVIYNQVFLRIGERNAIFHLITDPNCEGGGALDVPTPD